MSETLNDFTRNDSTRTATFSPREPNRVQTIGREHINFVLSQSRIDRDNARLLLHSSNTDSFHEMVIAQRRRTWFPPKKSPTRARSFHIISGSLCLVWLDQAAERVAGAIILKAGGTHMSARIPPDTYHADFPLSSEAVHLELSGLPKLPNDNVFPNDIAMSYWKKHLRPQALATLRNQR